MSAVDIYFACSGISGLATLRVMHGYDQPQSVAQIECTGCTLSLNDVITIDLGTSAAHGDVFWGYVKSIRYRRSARGFVYTITAYDRLVLARDYFIAADDPDSPLEIYNIYAHELVELMLNQASISSTYYTYDASTMLFAVNQYYPIDRVYALDIIDVAARSASRHCWCDASGVIHFEEMARYPKGSYSVSHTWITGDSGDIMEIERTESEESLRNRVVVYGFGDVVGVASAVSPHLPSGYYKTAVIGHPIIDSLAQAQNAASWNLTELNRLTNRLVLSIPGDYSVVVGDIATVTESETGTSGDWMVQDVVHSLEPGAGFRSQVVLRR